MTYKPFEFINPYNFIPFEEKKIQKEKKEEVYRGEEKQKKLLSGWLDVELLTKTKLIIPDGAHPKYRYVDTKNKTGNKVLHLEYDFFKMYNMETKKKEYAIPGSELRGLIRSTYETVTNSCLPFLMDDKPMSQRVPLYAALKKRGLLGYDGEKWVLYSTTKILEKVKIEKKGDKYQYKKGTKIIKEKPGDYVKNKGWVQYNLPVNLKKSYNIAYLEKKELLYTWESADPKEAEPYKKLKSALARDGVQNTEFSNGECNTSLKNALENACENSNQLVPVYYFSVVNKNTKEKIFYLSGSSVGRIAQRRKWSEIMEGRTPCKEELCPACMLFGSANDSGMKSHIRVSDAFIPSETKYKTQINTLEILASPRSSAFEFYLEKPVDKATYWNFDFYGIQEEQNGIGKRRNRNTRTNYYHIDKAKPRGRKMYWHHQPTIKAVEKNNMNNTMESIENATFTFKVYFDQVTEEQLKDLLWTITLGDNNTDSVLQHKLGHAKPLGYGSVKLIVTGGKVRSFCKENQSGYQLKMENVLDYLDYSKVSFDLNSPVIKDLLIMCNSEIVKGKNISYPRQTVDGAIYEWFSKNRINAKKLVTLPKPSENLVMKSK